MRVAFRMESGPAIGMGHMMRCLTLARALVRQGCQVMFLCSAPTAQAVRAQWARARCHRLPDGLSEAQDAARCRALLRRQTAAWLVVDHYGLGWRWEAGVKPAVRRVLAVDDTGRRHVADMVLDSGWRGEARYRGRLAPGAVRLFGPRFALLRDGVARQKRAGGGRVFVSFGGADPADMTRRVMRVLAGKVAEADIVAGAAYPWRHALPALCEGQPGWRVHVNHKAPEALMAGAVLAVGAGGGMTWERCAVGVPSIVVAIAENQRALSEALGARGVVRYLGMAGAVEDAALLAEVRALLRDSDARERMAQAGRRLVDGRGARRVAERMRRTA